MFRFGERAVRRGFSFERNVRRGTADSAARSERGEARRQETEKPRIRGMQGFVELPGLLKIHQISELYDRTSHSVGQRIKKPGFRRVY